MLSQYLSRLLVAHPLLSAASEHFKFQAMTLDLPLDCVATAPSISDTIRVHAALHPAIVSTDLPTTTFSELDCTTRQIGDELKAAGISAASRVGIVLPQNLRDDICRLCR
jgi:hypothetical protein